MPYSRTEIQRFWATLDERWPRLPPDDARRWVQRWRDGQSPYSRIRTHAIHLQLRAIITLALRCGLRRHEIWALVEDDMHYDNAYVVVWENGARWSDRYRTVPYTDASRRPIYDWLELRALVRPDHDRPWPNLWAADTVRQPVQSYTFEKLLRTYLGEGWTLKRLRDTCAVAWVRAGLPLEHLRQILGLATLEAVLPYVALAGGDVERKMERLDPVFSEIVGPAHVAA
jgi:integrase